MEWQDQGTVLTSRRHGESSAILEIFTQAHGRHVGVVRGATSRKLAPTLQPGTQVAVTWRARLEEHLGSFGLEPIHSRAGLMSGRLELAALNAITGLLSFTLPEREPHPRLYDQTMALLQMISDTEAWPMAYLHWEIASGLKDRGRGMEKPPVTAADMFASAECSANGRCHRSLTHNRSFLADVACAVPWRKAVTSGTSAACRSANPSKRLGLNSKDHFRLAF